MWGPRKSQLDFAPSAIPTKCARGYSDFTWSISRIMRSKNVSFPYSGAALRPVICGRRSPCLSYSEMLPVMASRHFCSQISMHGCHRPRCRPLQTLPTSGVAVTPTFFFEFGPPSRHAWPNPAKWPSGKGGHGSAPEPLPKPAFGGMPLLQICATRSWQTEASPF